MQAYTIARFDRASLQWRIHTQKDSEPFYTGARAFLTGDKELAEATCERLRKLSPPTPASEWAVIPLCLPWGPTA